MPAVSSKRHVVLPKGLDPKHVHAHHQQMPITWEAMLVMLVAIHLVAFIFWGYVLFRSKDGKRGGKGKHESGSSSSTAAAGGAGKKPEWRTPREILSAYNKQRLGKV